MSTRPTGTAKTHRQAPTAGLILLIFDLPRAGRAHFAPVAVVSYIGAAYWFTSSTSFANPAVTIGRAFTDAFAGIAPASVLPFIATQLVGLVVGVALVAVLFDRPTPAAAEDVVVPHGEHHLTVGVDR
jgi:glycerol uptake facilitator-like aquaporin